MSEAERKRLLIVAKNSQMPERNMALIYCSFGLGLRAKEIASLKISDVTDSDYKLLDEIRLKRSMTKGEKQRYAYLVNKKFCDALEAHIKHLKGANRDKPLFLTQRKSPCPPQPPQKLSHGLEDVF
ncbi:site-specific integrase [Legionella israelensis]|uniref:Site-specific tyrosine recombinase XerC n=1 Tax=Legionella israelensis TaxID=454 RepID=A0A0W0V762_9GAMM|nr:site-specific integrase [Legionella israelensis]KTD15959.1 site-specific tyrosine recombinase XerC [Legionella israelensis]QBS11225.1 site-specific integrase [Legionella israelensis]SCY61147.1 Phage integrase family protein [Legionella israelensis DSM 19235]STX61094.1 Phage_integrase [Legionella israelensis]